MRNGSNQRILIIRASSANTARLMSFTCTSYRSGVASCGLWCVYDSSTSRSPTASNRRAQGPQEAILRHAPRCGKTPVTPLCAKTHGPLNLASMHSCDARVNAHCKTQWQAGFSVLGVCNPNPLIACRQSDAVCLTVSVQICPYQSVLGNEPIKIGAKTSFFNSSR